MQQGFDGLARGHAVEGLVEVPGRETRVVVAGANASRTNRKNSVCTSCTYNNRHSPGFNQNIDVAG